MRSRDITLRAVEAIVAAAYSLDNDEVMDRLLEAAHAIRGATLMGNTPDRGTMTSLQHLLEDLGISFVVIGGMAVAVHGQERATADINVLVSTLPSVKNLRDPEYMGRFGFYRGRSHTGTHLVLDHKKGQVKLLLAKDSWHNWALRTAQDKMVLGTRTKVLTPEALIVSKLKAMVASPNRKAQDGPDVLSVLARNQVDHTEVERHLSSKEDQQYQALRAAWGQHDQVVYWGLLGRNETTL